MATDMLHAYLKGNRYILRPSWKIDISNECLLEIKPLLLILLLFDYHYHYHYHYHYYYYYFIIIIIGIIIYSRR